MAYVYCVTHRDSGTIYFGCTSRTPEERWRRHVYAAFKENSQSPFHQALRSYGREAFDWEVMSYHSTMEEGLLVEAEWIERGRADGRALYNIRVGTAHTTESRAKISAAQKGRPRRPFSDEHRAKLSAAKKGRQGRPHSDEARAKLSAAAKAQHARRRAQQDALRANTPRDGERSSRSDQLR